MKAWHNQYNGESENKSNEKPGAGESVIAHAAESYRKRRGWLIIIFQR
jgi:hypothetical protein